MTTTNGEAVPNGETVTVSVDSGTATCTVTLSAGTGTCTIANTALAAGGPYDVSASYPGDANLPASAGNAATGLTVTKDGSTTTTVSESSTSVSYGAESASTFSVQVTTGNGEPVPNGETLTVSVGTAMCVATLSSGVGSCTLPNTALPAGGPYAVSATYAGDGNLPGSVGHAASGLTVLKAPSTTTTVSVSPSSVTYGKESAAVFSVMVTSANGTPIPNGETVTVSVGNGAVTCTATLSGATGTCTIPNTALPAGGPYPVTASYAGDANLPASAGSAASGLSVAKDTVIITASIAPSPVPAGSPATITVHAVGSNGEPVPDGEQVTVNVGGYPCTVTLISGTGTCVIPANTLPPGGPYPATVTYPGDTNFSPFSGTPGGPGASGLVVTPAGGYPFSHCPWGYWTVASDGGIFSFGAAQFYGSMGGVKLNKPMVGMAANPDCHGYWTVASDGGIFSFGSSLFYGSMGGKHLNKPMVGMASTPDGQGYWTVASDGGIFTFGDGIFYGSTGSLILNKPMVGMAPTNDGKGYWTVSADGGVFTFGDAVFYGSTGSMKLNKPVVAIVPTWDDGGYWLIASDGGVFAFGDAVFYGSMGGTPLNGPMVGAAPTPDGFGYWTVAFDGGIFSFGDAIFFGSMGRKPLNAPMVGMAPL